MYINNNRQYKTNIRVAGIIVENDRLLLVKMRGKDNKEYFVLPGGGVEYNETIEEALIRELQEELGIFVKEFHLTHIREIKIGSRRGIELYFYITKYTGKITKGYDPEDKESEIHDIQFINLDNLSTTGDVHPEELIELIKKDNGNINPKQVIYLGLKKI